jgi:hypothetical protein
LVSLNHLTVPVTVDILFYLSFKNVTVHNALTRPEITKQPLSGLTL